MKTRLKSIAFLLFLASYSCKKDAVSESTEYPFVILSEVRAITSNGATFNASVTNARNQKTLDYGFVWSDSASDPTINSIIKSFGNNASLEDFSFKANYDLEKGKTYGVRAFVKTDKFVVYSNIRSFISEGCLPPVFTKIYPDSGSAGHVVTIVGKNFSSKISNNKLYFGTIRASVVKCNSDTILVQCPNTLQTIVTNVSLEVANQQSIYKLKFKLINPWERLNDFPGGYRFGSFSFVIGDKGYTASGRNSLNTFASSDLWQYDTNLDKWDTKSAFLGTPRNYASAFTINGKGYVSFGIDVNYKSLKDIWEYDPINNQWDRKVDFPGDPRVSQAVLTLNNKAYFVNNSKELWCYDPVLNNWSLIKGNLEINEIKAAHEYNGNGYLLSADGKFWEYNPDNNVFQYVSQLSITNMWNAGLIKSFYLKDNFYFATNPYWIGFNFQTSNTFLFLNWPFNIYNGINILFCLDEKVYLSSTENSEFWVFYPR
jgi:hypothetical protein